ncbi:MAG: NAD(P)/FAD-dependent oxidoreductase [Desulfuromonas sp.]|nr:NAD(P)/FAD-dependent oxidoreductase [Desulfuromonas sp.]
MAEMKNYDYIVIGSGIGGLFTSALLAKSGAKVCLLEQHKVPGGYGHSFSFKGYTFGAELHYIWNCSANEDGGKIFRKLGLDNEITFTPLNEQCFDRLEFPGFSYEIAKGFDLNAQKLSELFPGHRKGLKRYFNIIETLHDEMTKMPFSFSLRDLLPYAFRLRHVLRYKNWTTQDLFNHLGFPLQLQSILAGQSGNLLLSPDQSSLLVHAAMVTGLDRSACVPTHGYQHLFSTLSTFIAACPDCDVLFGCQVTNIDCDGNHVLNVVTADGRELSADNYIYNGDPKLLGQLSGEAPPVAFGKKLNYSYSPSAFTLYLGLKDIDLPSFGFGAWNVWHYADESVNKSFAKPLAEVVYENPTLFISTPTLHGAERNAPDGCEQMVVCTPCSYDYFKSFEMQGRKTYLAEKKRITNLMLDQVEKHYIPNLRDHIDLLIAGSPLTMERYMFAPKGNCYGADLTPHNFNIGKLDYRSPYSNLFFVGATAGIPSFAGGIHFAALLYEKLTGDKVL